MLNVIPLKFFCQLLLVVMLTITVNGIHERVHAMECCDLSETSVKAAKSPSGNGHVPAIPLHQHQEKDGCDSCIDCACHAPLPVPLFHLSYNPIILDLGTSEPYRSLPEVYLSKFIPPQLQA